MLFYLYFQEPNLCFVKSVSKAKDALNHNFKSYQHSCIPQLKNSDTRLFEIGSSNIKLLPPLKTPFKESSTFMISDFGKKEYFSSATDINFTDGIECSQFDVSTKYVQRKFSAADNEIDKLENKTSIESNSKIKEKRGFLDFLLRDDIKDCQNRNFKKVIPCIKKTGMNDLEMTQNSSFQSKDVTETKKCGSSNKPLICDNLLCENLNQRVQNILQSDNVPDGNLKKENVAGSSESVSKYWENSMNAKGVECKSNRDKYKVGSSKHMRAFLKHSLNTKTITSCHLDETSKTKFSGTRFELPWLG